MKTARILQSHQVAKLVGIPEMRIAKFIESPGYGLRPSLRSKSGKGIPRLYDTDDLVKIAFAWWMFQAGIKSKVIGKLLKDKVLLNALCERGVWVDGIGRDAWLIVRTELSFEHQEDDAPEQAIIVRDTEELISALEPQSLGQDILQIIPLGRLVSELWERLKAEAIKPPA